MISLGAHIVKAVLRLYTYPYRKRHASLSRSLKMIAKPYHVPDGFSWTVLEKGGGKAEILVPPAAAEGEAVVHFHGGGHTVGMNAMYRKVAERYARGTGRTVISVDYRTGKDLTHPALLADCFQTVMALKEAKKLPRKWVAAGDSMGANLLLAVCLKLRDCGEALPSAIVCVSPFVDLAATGESYRKNAYADPLYGLPKYQKFSENEKFVRRKTPYIGEADPKDPYLSPAYADFTGFPPLLIQCGGCETSASDADMLAVRARDAGCDVALHVYDGLFHDFQYLFPFLRESRRAWREIFLFFRLYLGMGAPDHTN